MNLVLVLGNQLFDPSHFAKQGFDKKSTWFFLREDRELASHFRYHKHKIILFFAAMRAYRDELRNMGYQVYYEELGSSTQTYDEAIAKFSKTKQIKKVFVFEIEDKFFEHRLLNLFTKLDLKVTIWPSPMFLTTREQFREYLKVHRKPFMKTFYEMQRKRLDILIENGQPVGGAWSFDTENRKPLPKSQNTPALPQIAVSNNVRQVIHLVDQAFPEHPGQGADFWLPVDRRGANEWLQSFLRERLIYFGPYEDAIPPHSPFLFHSVLTPFLNCGLLTPSSVIEQAMIYSRNHAVPLSSLEGFVRQVIGWREFIRGIYQNFDAQQSERNFWQHHNRLTDVWYQGGSGVPPLDETLRRVVHRGYAHHIERLMVVGSLMVLLEVHPQEAHRWFMEMFIDSSDWVMGPNVFGMAIFSDGGIFATKPYICGSNYLRKMGGYAKGDWCDAVDGLYWGFIKKHESYFLKNPRLSMMAKASQKISAERWKILETAAAALKQKLVVR